MRFTAALLVPVLAATLALTGCALSPQTINVTPTLNVTAGKAGEGHVVGLNVLDERSSGELGSRGGVYAKSSLIKPANDVAAAIHDAMKKGLEARGYQVGNAEAETVLNVAVQQLSYTVPEGAMATTADIAAAVKVTAVRDGNQHATVYRSTAKRKFPVAPSAEQNEEWVNETLGETLERFFADPEMRAFLNP